MLNIYGAPGYQQFKVQNTKPNLLKNASMSSNMKSNNSDSDSSEEFYDAEGPR